VLVEQVAAAATAAEPSDEPTILDNPAFLWVLLSAGRPGLADLVLPRRLPPVVGSWAPTIRAPLLHHAVSHALNGPALDASRSAGALQTVGMLVAWSEGNLLAPDARGLVAAQVAVEEAHLAEAADRAPLAEDLVWMVLPDDFEAMEAKLRLHKLYKGSSADMVKLLEPKRSMLSRIFKRAP